MTEKVCQLYEEEQIGKTRKGRKTVPNNKMPDLGWDIAEAQLTQENSENSEPHMTLPLQTLVTIFIMLITILEHTTAYIKEIPKLKRTARAAKSTITKVSHNELLQNIKDSYKTTTIAIAIATNTKDCTNHGREINTKNRNMENYPDTQKLNGEYSGSYQSYTSKTHNNSGN